MLDDEVETPEVLETRKMEVLAVQKTEEGSFNDAIKILTQAIAIAPKRASLYNNRAQVHRLQGNSLGTYSFNICILIFFYIYNTYMDVVI